MRSTVVVVVKLGSFRLNTGFESLKSGNYARKFISFTNFKQLNTISIVWFVLCKYEKRSKLNEMKEVFGKQSKIKYVSFLWSSLANELTLIVYLWMHTTVSRTSNTNQPYTQSYIVYKRKSYKVINSITHSQTKNKHNRATHKRMPMHFIRFNWVSCCVPVSMYIGRDREAAPIQTHIAMIQMKQSLCSSYTSISIATARTDVVVNRYYQ